MNQLEPLVEHTYVINLRHRTDRWANAQKQLAAIGWEKYERFDAYGVNNPPPARYTEGLKDFTMSGWWGNKFSHYGVIEAARRAGHRSIMVFEDDVEFSPCFDIFVGRTLKDLEKYRWDWLQFGGNHRYFSDNAPRVSPIDGRPYAFPTDGLVPLSGHLARIVKMVTAHAYLVKSTVYDFILEHAIASPLSIDGFYGYEVHPRFYSFCVIPCVARQIPGPNDIGGGYVDNTWWIGD